MSEITGKVKEIFQGEVASGRNAGDDFYSITLEENPDEKLTIFEEDANKGWIDDLEAGKDYTFTVKKTTTKAGKDYINIVGQTVPCIQQGEDQGGDMREEEGEEEKPKGKLVKISKKARVKPTSTAGDERVFKNRISALSAAVEHLSGTTSSKEVLTLAGEFYNWINE